VNFFGPVMNFPLIHPDPLATRFERRWLAPSLGERGALAHSAWFDPRSWRFQKELLIPRASPMRMGAVGSYFVHFNWQPALINLICLPRAGGKAVPAHLRRMSPEFVP
jgi:hypothetical protein